MQLRKSLPLFIVALLITACASPAEESQVEENVPESSWMTTFISPPAGVTSDQVYTFECELISQKPETLTTNCADFGEMVYDIKWSKWEIDGAIGEGIYSINECEPSCAEGTRSEKPVSVRLSGVTFDGEKYFLNTLVILMPGEDSDPAYEISWELADFYRMMSED